MKDIDVRVFFVTNLNLGAEYNRIITESKRDWVLFLEPNAFLCHPNWYYVCQTAIEQYPETGLFTCWTNQSKGLNKRVDLSNNGDDLVNHCYEAKRLFTRFKYECTRVTDSFCSHGFVLVNKLSWSLVGGFPEKGTTYEVCDFARLLEKNHIAIRLMQGMYIYQLKHEVHQSWISGVPTRYEMIEQECKLTHG